MKKVKRFLCTLLVLALGLISSLALNKSLATETSKNEYTPVSMGYRSTLWTTADDKKDDDKALQIVIYSAIILLGGGALAFIIFKYVKDVKKLNKNEEASKSENEEDKQ